ncbi:hypothetical protein [Marivita hallyeonensis]|uniref:hypothetical protein n=1 Tax=Marivita hallyeonensis TaxID=996342 RepID=UPI001160B285|nr:hypothetical protein [Marivita hallyeonensis]
MQDTLTLAALPPRPHAPPTASLGLGLPGALQHGPVTLLLTQSLSAELETFGGPDAWSAAGTLPLVLQGYTRAILTDRADVAASVGFAPWIPLALADRFPVEVPVPTVAPDTPPRLLIFDHGAPAGQAEVLRRSLHTRDLPLRVVTQDNDPTATSPGLVADLHLHLGYGPGRAVAGLSPVDSLLSGAYTLILPAAGLGAGKTLRTLCTGRSYGDLAPNLSELEARAAAMLDRLQAIRSAGERQNPEIARFAAANAAARAADYARFDAVLDAVPAPGLPAQDAA